MAAYGRRGVMMAAAAAALPAPFIHPARAQTTKKIVIGGTVPLSGAAAETGINVNNGYDVGAK